MTLINEWLPNPSGSDAQGEWIELFNDGSGTVILTDWTIKTSTGKAVALRGKVESNGYLLLKRGDYKFALKNQDESLFLYDSVGRLADKSSFAGTAPEGKSFSRINAAVGTENNFVFAIPTPGAGNAVQSADIIINKYPSGIPLNAPLDGLGIASLLIGTAIATTAVIFFVIKRNEKLFKLFFGSD